MTKMLTSAREAIRIAEKFFPADMRRQEDLAKEIAKAIELCEFELGTDILRQARASKVPSTHSQTPGEVG